jgi:hypothetical protein
VVVHIFQPSMAQHATQCPYCLKVLEAPELERALNLTNYNVRILYRSTTKLPRALVSIPRGDNFRLGLFGWAWTTLHLCSVHACRYQQKKARGRSRCNCFDVVGLKSYCPEAWKL